MANGSAARLIAAVVMCGCSAQCGGPAPSLSTPPAVIATASARATGLGASGLPAASPSGSAALVGDPNAAIPDPRDPRPPARLPGTTHEIDLVIDERFVTVAEGFVQKVWSISSQVPGPVIRVEVGDTVRVHLVNHPPKLYGAAGIGHPPVNDNPHALQFDGMAGGAGNETATLAPAAETVFQFKADTPGVWLYHGSTQPLIQDIAYGMYGMLIVEPKGGLAEVDQELFFVQGEWYVAPINQFRPLLPSLEKAEAAVPTPDFVVLNGIADQYDQHPIAVRTGARIRAFLLDAGPNLNASFRIEGATFDRVVMSGADATGAAATGDGAARVNLAPGQGAIVEFSLPRDGQYRLVTQAGTAAGAGARGILEAGAAAP